MAANKDYFFGYDYRASARYSCLVHYPFFTPTSLQSGPSTFLITQQIGHLLHPSITLQQENCRIGDVRAGTCLWAFECSSKLSPSSHFVCFDITPAQYPAQEWLSKNVSLHLHDAFTPFPIEYHPKYDLVNIRCFLCIVRNDDPSTLIKNVEAPGGSIQWVEANADSLHMIHPHQSFKSFNGVQKLHDFMATPRPNLR